MTPTNRLDRDRSQRSGWLIAVPAIAGILFTWLAWAAPEAPDVQEPMADTAIHPTRVQLEAIIRQRYPQLVTQRFTGLPVVTVLLNHDGTLAATDLEISPKDPGELIVTRLNFTRFGLNAKDLSYIGMVRLELPQNSVLVMFGGKKPVLAS